MTIHYPQSLCIYRPLSTSNLFYYSIPIILYIFSCFCIIYIGPQDHFAVCQNQLVLVDVDVQPTGTLYFSTDQGVTWSTQTITAPNCADGTVFSPRDSGYTLGVFPNLNNSGLERLIIIGGDDTDVDVWISDDCGRTFSCIINPEAWDPRQFSWIGTVPNVPAVFFGGGMTGGLPSVGLFFSIDSGITWDRPACNPADCQFPFDDNSHYLLPDSPACPGMFATDMTTLYFWDDTYSNNGDGFPQVWYLNTTNFNQGWMPLPNGNITNSWGRKVWLGGSSDPKKYGCWFSTDRDDMDMFVDQFDGDNERGPVNSMNIFTIAPTAAGPWVTAPATIPYTPRASAAVFNLDQSTAIIAGGMTWTNDAPSTPVFGDVWKVDAGVCLYAPNGQVCSGNGQPDLTVVNCVCNGNWNGDSLCGSCTPGTTYGPNCNFCPTSPDSSPCNSGAGHGFCDSVLGCVCSTGWTGQACTTCALNYAGPSCNACSPCNPVGGSCDGNGTTSGTGKCNCKPGYSGGDCSIPPPNPPSNINTNTGTLSPGGAAGVSITVLALAGIGTFFLSRSFGGMGNLVKAAQNMASNTVRSVSGGYSSISGANTAGEKVSLMSSSGTSSSNIGKGNNSPSKLSPEQAAQRFSTSLTSSTSAGAYGSTAL